MAVVGGDFSSESLFTLAQLTLQDKILTEKHGSKTIAVMPVEPIAKQAEKNPLLKPYVNVGAVALSPNSVAIGNYNYIKAAAAAAEGTGRINPVMIQSLMRDPNVLMAATGAPLLSFARSFGLLGTETASREGRFDTDFGNFYAAATITGANYSVRGAMHADNPDTAKIITNLLSSLMKMDEFKKGFKESAGPIPDKTAQAIVESFKLTAKDSEIMIEADVPLQMLADFVREQTKPKAAEATAPAAKKPTTRRPAPRKRRN
jgi:hypothetical protein